MNKLKHLNAFFTFIAVTLVLSACNLPGASQEDQIALAVAQTQLAQTQTALAAISGSEQVPDVETGAPPPETGPTLTLTTVPSLTPTSTITLTPTITLTLTPTVPMVSVSRNTNCRTGPGEPYEILGALLENEEAEVVGISSDGGTWIIKNPDGPGECWLWGYYATVTGPVEGLPVYTTPPTPTPDFTWAGNWTVFSGPLGGMLLTMNMSVTVNEKAFSAELYRGGGVIEYLTGTISDDYMTVSGTFSNPTESGDFTFYALGTDQFQGNGNRPNIFEWCGARGGAGAPVPCYKP